MDFTLTDEQSLLRETARGFLARECPPSLVRAHADDPTVADPLWAQLQEWVALADGPLVDLCLFLEECGAVLAPGPFFATTALYAPLVEGSDSGSGTVAWAGASGEWTTEPSTDDVRTFVLEADRVDHVAFVVPGPAVLVVAGPLSDRPVGALDSTRRLFEVGVPRGTTAARPIEPSRLALVLARATVALAAELVGSARWILDATVAYAKARVQFDQPIGSFQAVQHKLADMALAVEEAWSAVYYAAMALDADDPDQHRAVHVAKAAAGEAATRCAKDGIQIHGGIGYTWEHDLHLYIRRVYASEHLLGTTAWHHDRLADLLLGPRD